MSAMAALASSGIVTRLFIVAAEMSCRCASKCAADVSPRRAKRAWASLAMNIDKAKGRIPEAVKQAYCIVVTVNEANDVAAFRLAIDNEPLFTKIVQEAPAPIGLGAGPYKAD